MVRDFQKIIGDEARQQYQEMTGELPDVVCACVGGGSNSIGLFTDFVKEKDVEIFGVEGAGMGLETGLHSSAIYNNKIGIMHGMKTYTMQDENGNIFYVDGSPLPAYKNARIYLKNILEK